MLRQTEIALSHPISVKGKRGQELTTIQDAMAYMLVAVGKAKRPLLVEHAVTALMRASETGASGDIEVATKRVKAVVAHCGDV
ncbi:hypothetical protein [Aquabacter sp. CN5-332]|uniref:hypothetical protein n=1 Tax=Aquabacter sp. CN5-332 TaxID=3156608 RepID=UPI0032B543B6